MILIKKKMIKKVKEWKKGKKSVIEQMDDVFLNIDFTKLEQSKDLTFLIPATKENIALFKFFIENERQEQSK